MKPEEMKIHNRAPGGCMPMSKENDFAYFANDDCAYFPCHKNADPEHFNCLFCYCPLYMLDDKCGGNFTYTQKGIKDCSGCLVPHAKGGYGYIMQKFSNVVKVMEENRSTKTEGKNEAL